MSNDESGIPAPVLVRTKLTIGEILGPIGGHPIQPRNLAPIEKDEPCPLEDCGADAGESCSYLHDGKRHTSPLPHRERVRAPMVRVRIESMNAFIGGLLTGAGGERGKSPLEIAERFTRAVEAGEIKGW